MFEPILDDFETAWRQGARPDVRQRLNQVPEHQRGSLLFELLTIEVYYRRRNGEVVEPAQYQVAWPAFPSVIERVFSLVGSDVADVGPAESSSRVAPPLFSVLTQDPARPNDGASAVASAPVMTPWLGPGTWIGPYRLIRQLGIGGMGQVWLAEQTEPVKRQLALKLIKPELNSREVLARFAAERQALALMDHPNIARILDASTTDAGQPFFAMEFVDGLPLTKYCDHRQLTIKQRLELFATVCQGVQHAHQKGIIHRDLKPNNILVTEIDGRPQPKVIDFGLAKALAQQQRLTDESQFTQIGQILGTLKYISPEQAQIGSQDIDTRTDVYALGVILYELLTGTTPLDDSSLRGQAIWQAISVLRGHEPVKPSHKLSSSSQATLTSITAQRRTDVARLRSVLRGELDWIVMKALDKDRERRYESAASLAEDVRRCLAGHPVVARPPSWWYRTRRFLSRHPLSSAAMVLAIAATLVIGIQAYQVISVNDLLRRQQITSEFVDLVNRRVAGQRGWTWKNQEAILSLAGSGTKIVDPADWRSELLAAHMAVDVEFRETLAPEISFFDLKFHPQRPDELVAIDLKGLAGFPRYIRRLKISDDQTTEEAFSYSPDYLFELQSLGKQDGGRSLAFSQTGDLVACGTRAGDVIVRRYDQLDKDLIRIKTGRGAPLSVAFSPDARYLFALKEARLQRYDVENGFVMDLEQVVDQARQFKLLPNGDGLRLELGTEYDWELNPTATSAYANGYSNSTPAPHGLYVAATDQVRRVMVHDGNSTQPLRNLGEAALVVNLDFSPDGRFLCAAGDEQFRMWDLYDGRLVLDRMLLRGGRLKGAFSPDGRNLLITNRQGIDRYALQGAGVFRVHGIGAQPVHSFQQIGDGLLVVYHSFEVQQITVAYWDLSSGQLKNSIVLRPDELADVLPILVDPDRGQAVIGWRTKRESGVCVLDLHEPQWQTAPRQIFLIPDVLRWAALRDQRVLVSRDRDLWSWRGWQGQPDRTILDVSLQDRLRGSAKITVTQQLDGRWFAGSETGDWYCCEIEDGKSIAQGRVAAGVSISALAASPDGDGLAVGTNHGEVTLTSLRQPQPARVWQVGEDEVSALAWIDAQTLVSATRSGSIVVWNLDGAQPERYATLLPGGRPVVRMSYCPVQDALLFQQEGSYGVGQIAWPQLRQIIAAAGLD